jgi:hypothetical protein
VIRERDVIEIHSIWLCLLHIDSDMPFIDSFDLIGVDLVSTNVDKALKSTESALVVSERRDNESSAEFCRFLCTLHSHEIHVRIINHARAGIVTSIRGQSWQGIAQS